MAASPVDSDPEIEEEEVESCSLSISKPRCPTNQKLLCRENKSFQYFATTDEAEKKVGQI